MKQLFHCRINMLLVRRSAPFTAAEVESIGAMRQAVCDAVGKAAGGSIRTYVELEPRLNLKPIGEQSDLGASIKTKAKADERSTDKPKTRRKRTEVP